MVEKAVEVRQVSKAYGNKTVLNNVSCQFSQGMTVGLIGPNGAGKSTVIKIIMNLVRPSAGRAEVFGVDSTRLGAPELAQIGYVSENQNLPEWMRLDHFIDYCRAFYPSWDPCSRRNSSETLNCRSIGA